MREGSLFLLATLVLCQCISMSMGQNIRQELKTNIISTPRFQAGLPPGMDNDPHVSADGVPIPSEYNPEQASPQTAEEALTNMQNQAAAEQGDAPSSAPAAESGENPLPPTSPDYDPERALKFGQTSFIPSTLPDGSSSMDQHFGFKQQK
eukprot:GILJ01007587.1.p1 GENE.GILJ01007587.1~~GILJ01007587.1.p1  ORF type:complete len:150 (-),score=28.17 GILJ01007587.1:661-1110(-)